jgi:hypothetical protein
MPGALIPLPISQLPSWGSQLPPNAQLPVVSNGDTWRTTPNSLRQPMGLTYFPGGISVPYPGVVYSGTLYSGTFVANAATAPVFSLTIAGTLVLGNPVNGVDGLPVTWRITQDSSGTHPVRLDTQFRTPPSISVNWSILGGRQDILTAAYNQAAAKWDILQFTPGYF